MFEKIDRIKSKYGEVAFQEGIAFLLLNGLKNYRDINIEKEIRIADLFSMPSGRELDEKWFQAQRCAKELSGIPVFDIIWYLQEHEVVTDIRRFTTVQKPNPKIPSAYIFYTIISPRGVPAVIPKGHKVRGRPYEGAYLESYWIKKPHTVFQE